MIPDHQSGPCSADLIQVQGMAFYYAAMFGMPVMPIRKNGLHSCCEGCAADHTENHASEGTGRHCLSVKINMPQGT